MLIAALLLATPASAWQAMTVPGSDTEVSWFHTPVTYDIADDHTLDEASLDALDEAFDAWSSVRGADIAFRGGKVIPRQGLAKMDDAHLVFVDHDFPYGDEVLALAATWADDHTGEMVHFDLSLNGRVPWGTDGEPDRYDLATAVSHELGHVLGLDHTHEVAAVMHADLDLGEVRASLHDDDIAGLRHLYGATDDAVPFGCSTSRVPALGWLLIAPVALLARRRS